MMYVYVCGSSYSSLFRCVDPIICCTPSTGITMQLTLLKTVKCKCEQLNKIKIFDVHTDFSFIWQKNRILAISQINLYTVPQTAQFFFYNNTCQIYFFPTFCFCFDSYLIFLCTYSCVKKVPNVHFFLSNNLEGPKKVLQKVR